MHRLPTGFRALVLRRFGAPAALIAIASSSLLFGTGCETSCSVESNQEPIEVMQGAAVDGFYESNSGNEEFLFFPPERRYLFRHGLGGRPKFYNAYVSFWADPFENEHNAAQAAGNIVVFERITEEYIVVRNDTCEEFYLRVIASHPDTAP